MSGGPTVNLDGQVVAFNSFKIDPSLESQPFNFVRPDDIVKELMADVGVANEAGEITDKYRAGLDAYFAGDKAEAVGSLQSVVDQDPTNEFAQTYLAKAKQLPNTDQGFSVDLTGFAALAAMAAVALLLLTVVGGVTAIRRRGNRGGSATIAQPTYPIAGATAYESPVTNTSDASSDLAVAAAPIVTMVATRPSDLVTERRPTETEAEIRMSPVGFCTTCGAQAAPNQRFCGACGSPL